MPPRLIGEEPDYLPPYDPSTPLVTRAECRLHPLPPPRDLTLESHVAAERNRLYRRWISGVGWDRRRLHFTLTSCVRRRWPELQQTSFMGHPLVHRLLRRARIRDPYIVESGVWTVRRLTALEMRRVVQVAARMRAEKALGKELLRRLR